MMASSRRNFHLGDAVAVLERTPSSLSALLEGLPETWVRATEGDGTWSPYDVIGHLIEAERVNWMPRARHILETGPTRPFEPFARAVGESGSRSLAEQLATFGRLRRENVAALKAMNLTDGDLKRPGRHPELGDVTLGQLLATWVVHDMDHVTQIARTMAKVYTDATGPWNVYLSVLRDRLR